MLDTDARRRISANELVRDPYVACEDLRLTAFETAGKTYRNMQSEHLKKYGRSGVPLNITRFDKENIKDTHITTIEHLVSHTIPITLI
jgi:hypothetical protein